MPSVREPDRRSVAQKLFAIADAFADGDPLSLTEVASQSGLPISTAHRLLAEWVAWGGLVRDEGGLYHPGLALWRLGTREPTARRLREVARPYLHDLLEVTGEHVNLAVLDGDAVTYLDRQSGADAISLVTDLGSRIPLHASAAGLVLLAEAPQETLERLFASGPAKVGPKTVVDEKRLRARLAQVRGEAISFSSEEMTPGAFSVAAAVRDRSGKAVAAISVVGHVERQTEPQFALGIRLAARGMSAALGWRSQSFR